MPKPEENGADDPQNEALTRLGQRISAFEAKRHAEKGKGRQADGGAADGYRLLANLIGGVLCGLAFGWLFDHFAHTSPWGMIGGMLIGTALGVYTVVRSASRMTSGRPAPSATTAVDDDDDEQPGIFGSKLGD
jgi:ATP synthase protein I